MNETTIKFLDEQQDLLNMSMPFFLQCEKNRNGFSLFLIDSPGRVRYSDAKIYRPPLNDGEQQLIKVQRIQAGSSSIMIFSSKIKPEEKNNKHTTLKLIKHVE